VEHALVSRWRGSDDSQWNRLFDACCLSPVWHQNLACQLQFPCSYGRLDYNSRRKNCQDLSGHRVALAVVVVVAVAVAVVALVVFVLAASGAHLAWILQR
jgi:hypothetical protein